MNKSTIALLSILCAGMVQSVYSTWIMTVLTQEDPKTEYEYAFSKKDGYKNKSLKYTKINKRGETIGFEDTTTKYLYIKPVKRADQSKVHQVDLEKASKKMKSNLSIVIKKDGSLTYENQSQ